MLHKLFAPWMGAAPSPVSGARLDEPCGMNHLAAEFCRLWLGVQSERAQRMRCDARLVAVAQAHAEYLTSRQGSELLFSMHTGRYGSTPNTRVRLGGYALPGNHGDGNTCESCTRVSPDAARALEVLLASPNHRAHLLGDGFWDACTVYGVGQAGADWVVLACVEEET